MNISTEKYIRKLNDDILKLKATIDTLSTSSDIKINNTLNGFTDEVNQILNTFSNDIDDLKTKVEKLIIDVSILQNKSTQAEIIKVHLTESDNNTKLENPIEIYEIKTLKNNIISVENILDYLPESIKYVELPSETKYVVSNKLIDEGICLRGLPIDIESPYNYKIVNDKVKLSIKNNVTTIENPLSNINGIYINEFTDVYKNSKLKSINLSKFDASKLTNLSHCFEGSESLESLTLTSWNTSNVEYLTNCFSGCKLLKSLGLTFWNTSKVKNMSHCFDGCASLESLSVSDWNVSEVTDLSYCFSDCSSLQYLDVSSWKTYKVFDLSGCFNGCSSLIYLNVCNWKTHRVTNLSSCFLGCKSLHSLHLSEWNTSFASNFKSCFRNCSSLELLDISKWGIDREDADFAQIFEGCDKLKYIICTEDTFNKLKSKEVLPNNNEWTWSDNKATRDI